jgi:hypothetical protein
MMASIAILFGLCDVIIFGAQMVPRAIIQKGNQFTNISNRRKDLATSAQILRLVQAVRNAP